MARSGISVGADLQKAFTSFGDSKNAWIRVNIAETSFELVGEPGAPANTLADVFASVKPHLPAKEPTYFIIRLPGTTDKHFVVVFWCPDAAKVKDRMVFASSIASLKLGFGETKFAQPDTYRISATAECTGPEFVRARESTDQQYLLTTEETLRKEAEDDSAVTVGGSRVSAIMGLPIKVKDEAAGALGSFHAGKVTTVILGLNSETEVLETIEQGNFSLDDVAGKLDRKEPRYILHNFAHQREGDGEKVNAVLFIYYCPDTAKPKLKMFYSSSKAIIVQIFEKHSIELAKKLEASEPSEISSQVAMEELYPQKVVQKKFEKPKSTGRAGARRGLIGGTKFSAGGADAAE
jgi:twinfilin-like protein